jgi:hypothetical protein
MSTLPPVSGPLDATALFLLLDEFKKEVRADLLSVAEKLDDKVVLREVHKLEIDALQAGLDRLRHLLNRGTAAVGTVGGAALSAWLYHIFSTTH